jgi:hypothetical protein
MKRMDMDYYNTGRVALMYLAAAWGTHMREKIDWWDVTTKTPAESAATTYGTDGWITAKFERAHRYMIVTDNGFSD